jgi:murein DD-endopeptidase MepM/ murein hydrolase activator NlpD
MRKFALVLLIVIAAPWLLLLSLSSDASLSINPPVSVIGMDTPVEARVTSPHGVRRITASVEQNGTSYKVFEAAEPAHRLFFFGKNESRVMKFAVGRKQAPALRDGKARLVVEAQANDFRGSTTQLALDVTVNTQPPGVAADGFQHYVNQGGAELVLFTVSGYWTEAGVRVGPYTFRSFAQPGKSANERFALFAYPWDLGPNETPVVYARNPTGEEARAHFSFKLFPKHFRTRDLPLDDAFLRKVVDQIDPNGSGDLVARFVRINSVMRIENNKTLADLRFKSEERVLWSGAFLRYGKTESEFADTRNYIYKGKQIDRQTHLGFDLSDVQHQPVKAANDGKVLWADKLGIYGNCIVVDHGYGLQSIYGHLSEIHVKPGEIVKKGQEMGRSGSTGLAGGDHIHFSLQLDGVQITPVEWWDEHWIHDRILSKLPGR